MDKAFAPSMMNSRGTAGSSPRIIDERLDGRGVLRRPLDEAERMLVALRIDTDRCDQDQILVHVNAVDLDHQQIKAGEVDATHSFMRAADSATKRREAADFDSPDPIGAGTSPSGSRTERANLRVETLISIWFMAHLPSQSLSLIHI